MTKKFLKEFIKKKKEKEQLLFEINSMYEMRKSPVITGLPGSHGEHDKVGTLVAKIDEKIMRSEHKLAYIEDEEKEVEMVIDKLEDTHQRTIMRYRYLDRLKWEKIAEEMDFSVQHTKRLHAIALRKLNIK